MPGSSGFDGSLKFNTELDNEGFDKDSNKLLSAVTDLTKQINRLGSTMEASFSGITSILQELAVASRASASGMNDSAHRTAMAGAEAAVALENATTSTDQMSTSQTQQMAATDGAAQSMEQMSQVTDNMTQATQEATTAQTQVAEAADSVASAADRASSAQNDTEKSTNRAASAVSKYDKEIEKLQGQIADAEAGLSEYYERLNYYTEMMDRAETAKGINWQEDIQSANAAIDSLNERYATELANLDALEKKLAQVNAERNAALNVPESTGDGEAESNVRGVGREAEDAAPRVGYFREALTDLNDIMVYLANAALRVGKRVAQIGFKVISSGAKKATASLKALSGQTRKTTLTSNGLVKSLTSLKRLLITRIKRTFISKIFKDVQEGIQQLAKFDSSFNRTMSRMKNNATRLGGNIAVVIGNLITAVEPIITKIIDLLNTAIGYVNQFFAVLSGKTTYTAAKKGTEDYAKSVDKATKAQKKFNAELYSYDELTRQQKKDDDDNTSAIEYQIVPIDLPDGVTDWIHKLKLMWEGGNWEGVGKTIADGINAALRAVDDWINNKFRPWAVQWASRIGTIINGVVSELDWPLLGKTLADGINAVFDAVNTFLTTVDWLKLGAGIGATIKSWFDNIDWALVATTFANKWNALFNFIKGIVTTPGFWESIGTAIGTFIKNWFATIDLNAIVDTIVAILNGIPKAINAFLAQNPFEGVAEKIYNAINRIIHEVRWADLTKALGDLFKQLLGIFTKVIAEIDWKQIGTDIGTFLASIPWAEVLTTVGTALWEAFSGLIEGLFSTSDGKVFLALAAAILAFKTGIVGSMVGLGPALAVAGTAALGYAGSEWIKTQNELGTALENELNTALSCYKRLFEEKGPEIANQWAQTCYQINTEGMTLQQAGEALAHRIEELSGQTFANVEGRVAEGMTGITSTTQSALETYLGLVETHGIDVANEWFKMVTGIELFNDNLCTNEEQTQQIIMTNLDIISQYVESTTEQTLSTAESNVSSGLSNIESATNTGMNNLHAATSQGMVQVKAEITNNMLQAGNEVKRQNWSEVGTGVTQGIDKGIQGGWNWLQNTVSNLAQNLLNAAKSALGIHSPSTAFEEQVGENMGYGWEKGVENTKGSILKTVSNIANAIVDEAENGPTIHAQLDASMDGTVSGMQTVIAGLSDVAMTFKTIADTLAGLGGFTAPQIATGSVVPYKTKIAADGPVADDTGTTNAHLSGIESLLQQLIETMQSGGNSQIVLKVMLDGREIYQTVVDENNRQIQRTGASAIRV